MGMYVPQAVLSKDGVVLDADLVLSEIVADGDEVVLEYSEGPLAFKTRSASHPTAAIISASTNNHPA